MSPEHHCTRWSRRQWLRLAAGGLAGGLGIGSLRAADEAQLPPVRTVTRGPKHHWFGYYDKLEFDPDNRYLLGMEVGFEHRSPRPDDVIRVGMVDLGNEDCWTELGQSTAWGWQQGCMLQWRPASQTQILWNDRERDRYVCRMLDVASGERHTVPFAVYTVSPDGKLAVAADFRRIQDVRPGYGYVGLPDPSAHDPAPQDSGIFRIDLERGTRELILPIADIVAFGRPHATYGGAKHYVNHLLYSPDGSRFEFLHRWRLPDGSRRTRMLTANPDGSGLRVLDDNGLTSHFIWRDPRHILAWSNQPSHGPAFYLFEDAPQGRIEVIGREVLSADGHCSYLPGNDWILCDTYPDQPARNQNPFLYHVATGRIVPLGHFHSPPEYTGEWRCDTHPRFSRDGQLVAIDSPQTGEGRQIHVIDISGIVEG